MSKKLILACAVLVVAGVSLATIAKEKSDGNSDCAKQCAAKECSKGCAASECTKAKECAAKECAKECPATQCASKECAKECAAKECPASGCTKGKECAKECAAKECASEECAKGCTKDCAKECPASACTKGTPCAKEECAKGCTKECAESCAAKECTKACANGKECTKACSAEDEAECKAKCPVSGKDADKSVAVDYKGGKVFLCCPGCPGVFKKNTAKYAPKANHQLVLTGQAKQTGCPFSGGKLNPDTAIEVCGTKVCFCCNGCKSKATKVEGDAQVALLFGDKAFKKGFKVKEKKE